MRLEDEIVSEFWRAPDDLLDVFEMALHFTSHSQELIFEDSVEIIGGESLLRNGFIAGNKVCWGGREVEIGQTSWVISLVS